MHHIMAGRNKTKCSNLKYVFLRGLLEWEVFQRRQHYMKSAAEWTSKSIVSIDLTEGPIKSVRQAGELEGVGKAICQKLKEFQTSILLPRECPLPGQFVSSAPALLLALLIQTEQRMKEAGMGLQLRCYIPEEDLIPLASTMCEEKFDTVHSDVDAFCPALWRLNVLCTRGLVKKHSVGKKPAYELLPSGQEMAVRLKAGLWQTKVDTPPSEDTAGTDVDTPGHSNSDSDAVQRQFLYSNDNGRDEGLLLLIDTQEWGGDRVGLSQLVQLVERTGMKYRTEKLKCGDYRWVRRWGRREVTLPFLVERKRADDLARSLRDGRYGNQKCKMLKWRQSYINAGVSCNLVYLVEGKPEQYAVKCVDGCGAVLKCGYPTVSQIKAKIREINEDPEFELIETEDIHATVEYLQLVYAELLDRIDRDDFNELRVLDINPDEILYTLERKIKSENEAQGNNTNRNSGSFRTSTVSKQSCNEDVLVKMEQDQDGLPELPMLNSKNRNKPSNASWPLETRAYSSSEKDQSSQSKNEPFLPAAKTGPDSLLKIKTSRFEAEAGLNNLSKHKTPSSPEFIAFTSINSPQTDSETEIVIEDDSNDESQELLHAPLAQYHTSPRHTSKSPSGRQRNAQQPKTSTRLQEIDCVKGTLPNIRARNISAEKQDRNKPKPNTPQNATNACKASPLLKIKAGLENVDRDPSISSLSDIPTTEKNIGPRRLGEQIKKRSFVNDAWSVSKTDNPGSLNPKLCRERKIGRLNAGVTEKKDTETISEKEHNLGQTKQAKGSGGQVFSKEKNARPDYSDYSSGRRPPNAELITNNTKLRTYHPSCDLKALNNRRRLNFEASSSYGEFNVGETLKGSDNSTPTPPTQKEESIEDECDLHIVEKKLCHAEVSKPGLFKVECSSPFKESKYRKYSASSSLNSHDLSKVTETEAFEKVVPVSSNDGNSQNTQDYGGKHTMANALKSGDSSPLKFNFTPTVKCKRKTIFEDESSVTETQAGRSLVCLSNKYDSVNHLNVPPVKMPRLDINVNSPIKGSGPSTTDIIDLDSKCYRKSVSKGNDISAGIHQSAEAMHETSNNNRETVKKSKSPRKSISKDNYASVGIHKNAPETHDTSSGNKDTDKKKRGRPRIADKDQKTPVKGQTKGKKTVQVGTSKGKSKKEKVATKSRKKGKRMSEFLVNDSDEDTEVSSGSYIEDSEVGGSIDLSDDSETSRVICDISDVEEFHGRRNTDRANSKTFSQRKLQRKVQTDTESASAISSGAQDKNVGDLITSDIRNRLRRTSSRSSHRFYAHAEYISDNEDDDFVPPGEITSGSRKILNRPRTFSEQMKKIEQILPNFDHDQGIRLLHMYDGSVEMAVAAMLEDL